MQMRKENEEDENQAFAQFAYFLHNQWHTKMSLSMHPAHTHTHIVHGHFVAMVMHRNASLKFARG